MIKDKKLKLKLKKNRERRIEREKREIQREEKRKKRNNQLIQERLQVEINEKKIKIEKEIKISEDYNFSLAFYTCFYGSDKNIRFQYHPPSSLKYDFYYFTNNKTMVNMLKDSKWIVIFDDVFILDDIIDSCMVAKYIKSSPHKFKQLQKYTYTCYHDNCLHKINIEGVERLIKSYFIERNYSHILSQHYFIKGSINSEVKHALKKYRYFIQKNKIDKYINKQINSGLKIVTNKHATTCFIIRNMRHNIIQEIDDRWYQHILDCGILCQASFFFIKQLYSKYIYIMGGKWFPPEPVFLSTNITMNIKSTAIYSRAAPPLKEYTEIDKNKNKTSIES
tara:strand:+ start:3814 stop:4821 length:1008 start_codon:yes stop_codon:yes gene_type:complete